VRIGVQLPEVEREVRWPEHLAIARAAESAGFDSIWVGDHLLYRGDGRPERGPWHAWAHLAALAASTDRVDLGPLVACLGFLPPAILAKVAATVDEVSGGRLVLGVGAGWNEAEFVAFGVPFDRRAARFEEAFPVVHRLLDGERVTFHGGFVDVEDAVLLPAPARRIPLMVGSLGPRVLAASLPRVDAWNAWYTDHGNTPEGFEVVNRGVTEAARRAGRDPSGIRRSACVLVRLDPEARERSAEEVPAIEGGIERIAGELRSFAEAGVDEVILVVDPITATTVTQLGGVVAELRR
jgi:probable F420-dependent oxidoreductase